MVYSCFPSLLFLMFMTVSTAETGCSKNLGDKSVLLCFKNGLENNGGSALSSWDLSLNISTWKGIQWNQDMANPRVLSINLTNAGLAGSLWPFWCGLPLLKSLNLYWNNLTGHLHLDADLCHKNNSMLQHFNLGNNFLSGHIPTTISTMRQLRYLWLAGNYFTGPIPSSLGNCAQLEELVLSNNLLSGEIPVTISNCTKLRRLFLSQNSLTGKLPSSIGNLSNLRVLALDLNKLNGDLPSSIGLLDRLKILDVGINNISGSFPNSMARMSSLQYLSVSTNRMGGYIPEWIGNFSKLRQLDLWQNNFIGGIPVQLANLTFMKARPSLDKLSDPDTVGLVIEQNLLPTGGASKKDLLYFYHAYPIVLDLCDNDLTGSIPPELGTLHSLQQLWLCGNRLTGSIPPALSNAADLILLQLYDNELNGEIPNELTRLSYLTYFNVSRNRLSGRIPSSGQFSTFDASSFFGNTDLCGLPLNKSCTISAIPPNSPQHEEEDEEERLIGVPFAVGVAIGFAFAFLNIVFLLPQTTFDRVVNKWRRS